MIETLDYQEVPFHFVHCLRADCPKASTCLRYQVARFLPVDKRTVTILNPALVSNSVECKEYLSDTPVFNAYGMSKLFDELPYAKVKHVRDDVISRIGKTQYYRMKNETIGITPVHQCAIKKIFLKYGIEDDPVFDRYEPVYPW